MMPAPAHHGYEPVEAPNWWSLYYAEDIQDAAIWWLPETFFMFYEQAERFFVDFIGLQGASPYLDLRLEGICDEDEAASVSWRVYRGALDEEQRTKLLRMIYRAYPAGTRSVIELRRRAGIALQIKKPEA